jgi:Rrf2 family protein
MLRLSKRVEYGLIAMQHIAGRAGAVVSAKEISEQYSISFELLSKVLHRLSKAGCLVSLQGVQGGYILAQSAADISVANIINAVEGRQNIVECTNESEGCTCQAKCTIKSPMEKLQAKIDNVFQSMTIAEMIQPTVLMYNTIA